MGALAEASQWHVQGFGLKVSSFPSPGSSPTATRTTVNMLLTVLASTARSPWTLSSLGRAELAGGVHGTPRRHLWAALKTAVFWWQKLAGVCPGIPCLSPGRSWARDGSGAQREDGAVERFGGALPENHHLPCSVEPQGTRSSTERRMFPMLSVLTSSQIQFPFLIFSLLQSPFLSPWSPILLLPLPYTVQVRAALVSCCLDLLKALVRSNRNTRPDTTATHAQGVGRQDGRQAQIRCL